MDVKEFKSVVKVDVKGATARRFEMLKNSKVMLK